VTWPEDIDDRIDGRSCVCRSPKFGLGGDGDDRISIYEGDVSIAYLIRHAAQPGYAVVMWKKGHACEPSMLSPDDADRYGRDVLLVGAAVQQHYSALKVNYLTLGNQTVHLHTNVVARFHDDVAPGELLNPTSSERLPEDRWRADAAALRALLADGSELVRRWSTPCNPLKETTQ